MKTDFMNKFTRTAHMAALKVQKHMPEILAATGVIGIGVSGVMLCKATTKLNPILEETQRNIELVHAGVEKGYVMSENPETKELVQVEYSAEDGKKDLAIYYSHGVLKVAKLYAPAIVVGVFSVGCMLGSNHILRKRNVALAAAYTAVDKSFKEYRSRVRERLGDAMDRELLFNVKAKEIEEQVVDPETGEVTTVKTVVDAVDPNGVFGPYTFVFDETCAGWERDAELNKFFLLQQQNHANDRLKAQGHLFLNEVLDMLGMDRVKMGNIVGWMYDKNGNQDGDGYVDFGIFDMSKADNRRFVNGQEKSIWLDFNVDGNILELMP